MGKTHIVLLVFFCVISFVLGCGEPKPKHVNWQDAMQVWFSNTSVRPTEPPRDLWTRKDEELFLRRIGFADIVAIGTVRVVTLFSNLGADQQVGLAFSPIEVLHGSLEDHLSETQELYLRILPSDKDFHLARKVQQNIAGSHYVLLLKQKPNMHFKKKKHSKKNYRWALYRPDKKLMAEIRAMYKWLRKKDRKED